MRHQGEIARRVEAAAAAEQAAASDLFNRMLLEHEVEGSKRLQDLAGQRVLRQVVEGEAER